MPTVSTLRGIKDGAMLLARFMDSRLVFLRCQDGMHVCLSCRRKNLLGKTVFHHTPS